MRKYIIHFLLLSVVSSTLSAAHVIDKLVVGLYSKQDLSGEPLALLESDTPVDILQQKGDKTKVRLADQREGWMESRYVTEEKPARMILLETQAELRQLKAKLAEQEGDEKAKQETTLPPTLKEQTTQQELLAAQVRIAKLERGWGKLPETVALKNKIATLENTLNQARDLLGVEITASPQGQEEGASYVPWLVGIFALGCGVLAGFAFSSYRVSKRYGGLRV